MKLAAMAWVSSTTKRNSILGVLDRDNPGKLPMLSEQGHWAEVLSFDESQLPDAGDARKAIAVHGYYLTGTSDPAIRTLSDPPT
jgi:hypothetical protein